jgi:hypothetical protein
VIFLFEKNKRMRIKFTCFAIFLTLQLMGQNTINIKPSRHLSVQWLGWTFHPGGSSLPENTPWKLDPKGMFILNPGVAFSYDFHEKKHVFWRAAAGYYGDCALLNAGYLHIGFRWEALRFGRHTFNGGFGPGFFFRQDWHRFKGYKGDPIYGNRVWQGWQYRMMPIGEVEYLFKINSRWQFQYSVIPGYPVVVNSRMGVRWLID